MISLLNEAENREWVDFINRLVDDVVAGNMTDYDSKCEWIDQFKAAQYFAGESAGTVDDFNSRIRRNLVIDVNVALRRSYRRWISDLDPDIMEAFPGWQLTTNSASARKYWKARWISCGGMLRKNKMVALKVDPIWAKLSWFGFPFEPLDIILDEPFVEDIDFDSCRRIGIFDGISHIEVPDPIAMPRTLFFLTVLPSNMDVTAFANWLKKAAR